MATTTGERPTDTAGWPPIAVGYLAAVEEELAGIEAEERQDLLEDLCAHIDALFAEEGAEVDLIARLGTPMAYAEELVESAGLTGDQGGRRRFRQEIAERLDALRSDRRVGSTLTWLRQLRPAWWVFRGYGLALLVGTFTTGQPATTMAPVPFVLGSPVLGLVVTLGLIWLSVEVGAGRISSAGRIRWLLVTAGSVLAVLTVVAVGVDAANCGPRGSTAVDPYLCEQLDELTTQAERNRQSLSLPGGEPVTNVYAFDVEGNALEDVLLYDGVGNPIVLQQVFDGRAAPFSTYGLETDYRRDAEGRIVPNLYPLTQFRVGTQDPFGPVDMDGFGDGHVGPRPSAAPDRGPRAVPEVTVPRLGEAEPSPAAPAESSSDDLPTADPAPTPTAPETRDP